MKDLLKQLISEEPHIFLKRNLVREYLQARILRSLQDHGAFSNWAFVGGTALRFLFQLPRYSEDLDFSLTGSASPNFRERMQSIQSDLRAEAYTTDIKVNDKKTVAASLIKFRGLLHELDLSPLPDETLSIKVEMDTNPPENANTTTTIIRRFEMLHLFHYDKASLLAGKLHAILTRPYTKGRDLYDIVWYLSDPSWPPPNIPFLNAALVQSKWAGQKPTLDNWKKIIHKKFETINWSKAKADVEPFLARPSDIEWVHPHHIEALLS